MSANMESVLNSMLQLRHIDGWTHHPMGLMHRYDVRHGDYEISVSVTDAATKYDAVVLLGAVRARLHTLNSRSPAYTPHCEARPPRSIRTEDIKIPKGYRPMMLRGQGRKPLPVGDLTGFPLSFAAGHSWERTGSWRRVKRDLVAWNLAYRFDDRRPLSAFDAGAPSSARAHFRRLEGVCCGWHRPDWIACRVAHFRRPLPPPTPDTDPRCNPIPAWSLSCPTARPPSNS